MPIGVPVLRGPVVRAASPAEDFLLIQLSLGVLSVARSATLFTVMGLLLHARSLVLRICAYLYELFAVRQALNVGMKVMMSLVELDVVPDWLLRHGIRALLRMRLTTVSMAPTKGSPNEMLSARHIADCRSFYCLCFSFTQCAQLWVGYEPCCRAPPLQMAGPLEDRLERKMAFVEELRHLPVAVQTAAANEQHYEV